MKTAFLAIFICLLASATAFGEDKTFLYGEYYEGMTREDLEKSGPAICDDYPARTVCSRHNILFAGIPWTQFFEFHDNGLVTVAFGQHATEPVYKKMLAWFQASGYMPTMATGDHKTINLSFWNGYGFREKDQKALADFQRETAGDSVITISFIKLSDLRQLEKTKRMPQGAVMPNIGIDRKQGILFITFEPASASRSTLVDDTD